MPFYTLHRSLVRAKVALLRAEQVAGEDERRGLVDEATRRVNLGAAAILPPALVLMCGLPATGKSWLARELARPFAARVLRSDVVRKALEGHGPTRRFAPEETRDAYGAAMSERVYRALARRALESLQQGRTVIVDATFQRTKDRRRFVDMARRLGHPLGWWPCHNWPTRISVARSCWSFITTKSRPSVSS